MSEHTCGCGSGLERSELYDARGIFCCFLCPACRAEKTAKYRTDVLTDSDYVCDEQIDEDY